MAARVFRVHLATAARDYQPRATEPGLAMLDRNSANYTILRKWFGDVVAEPEWEGEELVGFYVREEKRGRLEQVDCEPVNKWDLTGHLKEPFEAIGARLRKIQPESTTEQTLLRIVGEQYRTLSSDLEASDYDSFFFKYREGKEPWKLLFAWGYQRGDMQPGRALICSDANCGQLYVHRQKTKAICPGCQVPTKRKKYGAAARLKTPALLLLLLLLALFLYAYRPRLEVTPAFFTGPPGSRVEFQVQERKWYFFDQDVTHQAQAVSQDQRVVEFAPGSTVARAKSAGQTVVTLRYGDRVRDVGFAVVEHGPPNALAIDPGSANLGIGSTVSLRALGDYGQGDPIDLSEVVTWQAEDAGILYVHDGLVEGVAEGKSKVVARFPAADGAEPIEAVCEISVARVDYQSLEVAIDPITLPVGDAGVLTIDALDGAGTRYSMTGSSLLEIEFEPRGAAHVDGDSILGKTSGGTKLLAQVGELSKAYEFMIVGGDSNVAFFVAPQNLKLRVHEYYTLDVAGPGDAPVEVTSSDPHVVEVIGGAEVAGRAAGTAELTVRKGSDEAVVQVEVVESVIERLAIEPASITLQAGKITPIRVVGYTEDGAAIEVAPSELTWVKQPTIEYADLNRDTWELFGIQATPAPQELRVRLGDQEAIATVEVIRSPLASELLADEFLVYPPIGVGARVGATYLGDGLTFGARGGLVVNDIIEGTPLALAGIPSGSIITGVDGIMFEGSGIGPVKEYLSRNPIMPGSVFQYRDAGGELHVLRLPQAQGFAPVTLRGIETANVGPDQFDVVLSIELREEADYRLLDANGNPLSETRHSGPFVTESFAAAGLPRTGSDEYKVFVERSIGGEVRRFEIAFELKLRGQ
ncbi:MAG: hypothetical protein KDA42_04915 [Planctomycetales bacterium]|nr:hypothetical protein [Planctomycetales bacterium]